MYFTDRMMLGNKLADNLKDVHGTDAILVCLKESSMMVAISMAIKLRAWIFPLFYEKLISPLDQKTTLGAINQNGEFCLNPDVSDMEYDYVEQEFMSQMEDAKREAMSRLNWAMNDYHGTNDPHILNNRNVVLVGDIMFNSLELEIAKILMKPLKPAKVYGTVGNVTADVSDRFHLNTNYSYILDILPTSVFGEDHYFESQDAYSQNEKQAIALNIAQYWA